MEKRQYQLNLKEYVASIRSIYGQHDELGQEAAKSCSMKHRKASKCSSTIEELDQSTPSDASLTYGEVTAADFMNILSNVERLMSSYGSTEGRDKVFVDLGCGRGLPCACAAISTLNFVKVWGIEIIPELVDIANKLRDVFVRTFTTPPSPSSPSQAPKIPAKTAKAPKAEFPLIHYVQVYMLENVSEGDSISLEALADVLCKQLGHKKYRELLKGFKTLRKCLQNHTDIFNLVNEDQNVELVDRSMPRRPTDELHGESESVAATTPPPATAIIPPPQLLPLPAMAFECGDIFTVPWWETADVVYVASLLFSEEMLLQLTACVARMRPRAWVLSLQPLPDTPFNVVLRHDSFFKMSWQMAKVYFYQVT